MITPKPDKRTPVEFTPKVTKTIKARAKDRCEGCGRYLEVQLHHRLYKSRGGRGTVANGLALCGLGNASGCHGKAHTGEGEALGWSVPSGIDPLIIPARLWVWDSWAIARQQWFLLHNDGRRFPITDSEARRRMEGRAA